MLGELDPAQIEAVLAAEVIARIGCLDGDRVYVVPVSYVYDGTYVWGHGMAGAKMRAMRAHPRVCVEVEQVDDLSNWRSVIAWGEYEECHGADREAGMALLVERVMPLLTIPPHRHPDPSGPPHGTVYRIRLEERTGRFEQVSSGGNRNR